MGLVNGKISVHEDAIPFLHLPKRHVINLREAFHDIAEGFSLNIDEFWDIIRLSLKEYLEYIDEKKFEHVSKKLFYLYLDNKDGDIGDHPKESADILVDSFEFISSICLLSGMNVEDKIEFLFIMYTFDESGSMATDDFTLMCSRCLSGLRKVCIELPEPNSICNAEDTALAAFASKVFNQSLDNKMISNRRRQIMGKDTFLNFVSSNPEILCWISCLDNVDETPIRRKDMKCNSNVENFSFDRLTQVHNFRLSNSIHYIHSNQNSGHDSAGLPLNCDIKSNCFGAYPSTALTLEWVYGLNSSYTRQHVHYIPGSDSIVYPAGSMCVILTKSDESDKKLKQKFYHGHSDYVSCICITNDNQSEPIVASGEIGLQPIIHVWSVNSVELHSILHGVHSVSPQYHEYPFPTDLKSL